MKLYKKFAVIIKIMVTANFLRQFDCTTDEMAAENFGGKGNGAVKCENFAV